MFFENLLRALKFLAQGQFRRVWNEVRVRIYRFVYEVIWRFVFPFRRAGRPMPPAGLSVQTQHPVAIAVVREMDAS
jgi:hypothetical protein